MDHPVQWLYYYENEYRTKVHKKLKNKNTHAMNELGIIGTHELIKSMSINACISVALLTIKTLRPSLSLPLVLPKTIKQYAMKRKHILTFYWQNREDAFLDCNKPMDIVS